MNVFEEEEKQIVSFLSPKTRPKKENKNSL